MIYESFLKVNEVGPGQVAQLVKSIFLIYQVCKFNPWSGHLQEATNE